MVDLEDMVLSKISQTEKYALSYMWSLKTSSFRKTDMWLTETREGDGRGCKMGEGTQKVQTNNHQINKSWGCHIPHGDYSYQYHIVYLKVAKS